MGARVALIMFLAATIASGQDNSGVITSGTPDDFRLGTEPAAPSPELTALFTAYNPNPLNAFDETCGWHAGGPDQSLATTLTGIPPGITDAILEISIRGGSCPGPETDLIALGFANSGAFDYLSTVVWERSIAPTTFPTTFYPDDPGLTAAFGVNGTATLVIDLSDLEQPDGTPLDLRPLIGTAGFLDVVVGDESAVDFVRLHWTTEPGGFGSDPTVGFGAMLTTGSDYSDAIETFEGADVVLAGLGHDWVDGGRGNDSLHGDDGDDVLFGGEGSDYLFGGNGDDDLYGGDGSDALCGGTGSDRLAGGPGLDDYAYAYGDGDLEIVDTEGISRISLDVPPFFAISNFIDGDLQIAVIGPTPSTSGTVTIRDYDPNLHLINYVGTPPFGVIQFDQTTGIMQFSLHPCGTALDLFTLEIIVDGIVIPVMDLVALAEVTPAIALVSPAPDIVALQVVYPPLGGAMVTFRGRTVDGQMFEALFLPMLSN